MKQFGKFIRELREKKDFSLREFAEKIGKTAAFISDIELGRRYPSEGVLSDMAKVLDVVVDELKKYDPRIPVEDLRRKAELNPSYGVAFRKVADSNVSPQALIKWLSEKSKTKGKK